MIQYNYTEKYDMNKIMKGRKIIVRKILRFKVYIENLEGKIERIIEINDAKTVADLAYTILTTFDSLAYHLYNIKHNNIIYDCAVNEDWLFEEKTENAITTKIRKLDFSSEKTMKMTYDYSSPTIFLIKLLETKESQNGDGNRYPKIIDGKGQGMLDDITSEELLEIIKDTDKRGYSIHQYSPGYERDFYYDYRDYDLDYDSSSIRARRFEVKYAYEQDLD